MLDLKGIKARAEAATAAPWRPDREPDAGNDWFDRLPPHSVPVESTGTQFALGVAVAGAARREDAVFISAAREDIPALVTEVERLRSLNAEAAKFLRANEWTMPAVSEIRALAKRLEANSG